MNAKRIIAPDMRRALKLVREQLGDDAVILQNKTIAEGVELIATTEKIGALVANLEPKQKSQELSPTTNDDQSQEESLRAPANPPASPHKRIRGSVRKLGKLERFVKASAEPTETDVQVNTDKSSEFAKVLAKATKEVPESMDQSLQRVASEGKDTAAERYDLKQLPVSEPEVNPQTPSTVADEVSTNRHNLASQQESSAGYELAIGALQDEVALLRALLMSQSAEQQWSYFQYAEPLRAHLLQKLIQVGFDAHLAKQWVLSCEPEPEKGLKYAWRSLLNQIVLQLPVTGPGVFSSSEALALLGPTGAGKTATICKLATLYVLESGLKDLAVISTDAFRMGATDELSRLCQILEIPLHVVDGHEQLAQLLTHYSGQRKVLIDTAGLVSSDGAWSLQCKTLLEASQNIKHLLVLATTHQLQVHQKAIEDYGQLPLQGCVLTKLDECERLAESLNAVIQSQLPVAYVTKGMCLTEDLLVADRLSLVKSAFETKTNSDMDPVMMAQCFESLSVDLNQKQRGRATTPVGFGVQG